MCLCTPGGGGHWNRLGVPVPPGSATAALRGLGQTPLPPSCFVCGSAAFPPLAPSCFSVQPFQAWDCPPGLQHFAREGPTLFSNIRNLHFHKALHLGSNTLCRIQCQSHYSLWGLSCGVSVWNRSCLGCNAPSAGFASPRFAGSSGLQGVHSTTALSLSPEPAATCKCNSAKV